jgi:hypothetical protein
MEIANKTQNILEVGMSDLTKARFQTVLIILIISPIISYIKDRTGFSFEETLGVSPWLVFAAVLSICLALGVYGRWKRKA